MRSPRRAIIEKIRDLCDTTNRYVDTACKVSLYKRSPDGLAAKEYTLPRAYGGVYDRFSSKYDTKRTPQKLVKLKIHKGQLPLVSEIGSPVRRILCLGSPGGGKSMGIITVAVILSLRRANGIGGVVAPTRQRMDIVWKKFLDIVQPAGLVADISLVDSEIKLTNGTLIQFRAAARRSAATGSPIAGLDWHWAVEDEQQDIDDDSLREVDARGRINKDYQVFSSATNEAKHEFQMRLAEYEKAGSKRVLRFSGPDNCFTPMEHWEALRRDWSQEDYDRYINCLDIPKEGRVYPQFSYADHTAQYPKGMKDITKEVTYARYRVGYSWVVGWDPGQVTSASVILKCFSAGRDERHWYVVDELTTRDASTEWHAKDLANWFTKRGVDITEVLVLGDPHENKDTDKSDYIAMGAAGFHCKRSNSGFKIERKHRISMVNALLRDSNKRKRLFLVAGESGPPKAAKLAECLGHLMYAKNGEIDFKGKTIANIAHWGDAMGYALYPFEQMRGTYKPHSSNQLNNLG